jgi:bacteriocin resistance YdeI/OmpD-like protein/uncharacterized protein DUF1905
MPEQHFRTTILQGDKTATGIVIPEAVVAELGSGKKPPVRVTLNGYTYRSTVATVSGAFMVGVSADVRAAAGVKGGDELEVTIDLDTAPRVVDVPADFAAALAKEPAAKQFYEGLSYSLRRLHADSIASAKTPETRERRLAKTLELMRAGKAR